MAAALGCDSSCGWTWGSIAARQIGDCWWRGAEALEASARLHGAFQRARKIDAVDLLDC
ncbi:MAG: hypothetical protein U1E53_33320 [Dongiaceae bacterium]